MLSLHFPFFCECCFGENYWGSEIVLLSPLQWRGLQVIAGVCNSHRNFRLGFVIVIEDISVRKEISFTWIITEQITYFLVCIQEINREYLKRQHFFVTFFNRLQVCTYNFELRYWRLKIVVKKLDISFRELRSCGKRILPLQRKILFTVSVIISYVLYSLLT